MARGLEGAGKEELPQWLWSQEGGRVWALGERGAGEGPRLLEGPRLVGSRGGLVGPSEVDTKGRWRGAWERPPGGCAPRGWAPGGLASGGWPPGGEVPQRVGPRGWALGVGVSQNNRYFFLKSPLVQITEAEKFGSFTSNPR